MVVEQVVETVDIVPTICDLMGLELPDAAARAELASSEDLTDEDKRALVDGHSLVPLVEAAAGRDPGVRKGDRWDGFAFAENGPYLSIRDARWKLVAPREGLDPATWADSLTIPDAVGSVPTAEELAALSTRPRLFDLANDPLEREDLILSNEPDVVRERDRLYALLVEWSSTMPVPLMDVTTSHRDLENAQNMEALGYTGNEDEENPADRLGGAVGGSTGDAEDAPLDEPAEGSEDDPTSGAADAGEAPSAGASAPE